jgi:hypothetical protein
MGSTDDDEPYLGRRLSVGNPPLPCTVATRNTRGANGKEKDPWQRVPRPVVGISVQSGDVLLLRWSSP